MDQWGNGCSTRAAGAPSALKTSDNSDRIRKFGGYQFEDILPRVSGKMSAERRAARRSVRSATEGDTSTDGDTSWSDDGRSGNGTCGDHAGCGDAARPIDTGSTDNGVGFHSAKGDESPDQQ
jgi:hypothetical protein